MSEVATCSRLAESAVRRCRGLGATCLEMAGSQIAETIGAMIAERTRGDQNGQTGKGSGKESWIAGDETNPQSEWNAVFQTTTSRMQMQRTRQLLRLRLIPNDWLS